MEDLQNTKAAISPRDENMRKWKATLSGDHVIKIRTKIDKSDKLQQWQLLYQTATQQEARKI